METTRKVIRELTALHDEAKDGSVALANMLEHYVTLLKALDEDVITGMATELEWGENITVGTPINTYTMNQNGILQTFLTQVANSPQNTTGYTLVLNQQINWLSSQAR